MNTAFAGLAMLGAAFGATLKTGEFIRYSLYQIEPGEEGEPWSWMVEIVRPHPRYQSMTDNEILDRGIEERWDVGKEKIRETIESRGYSVKDARRSFFGGMR